MANPEIDNYVPMIIYNVLVKDRHCDPEIYNFTDKEAAINFARQNAREFCRFLDQLEDLKETIYDPEKENGWILLIEYSCEGDYVRITEGELK